MESDTWEKYIANRRLEIERRRQRERRQDDRKQGRHREMEVQLLLAQESLERQMKRRPAWDVSIDPSSKSDEMPSSEAGADDGRRKQALLKLHKNLLEELKQNLEKPVRQRQIMQDEELAWRLIQQDLQIDDWNDPNDRNAKSQDMPNLQAAGAARRDKQERYLHNGSSKDQLQHSEKPLREQQLARPMEHGSSSSSEDPVYDLFFAVSTDDRGLVGGGCIIKDADGQVVSQNRKCIGVDISHHLAEYSVLIMGLKIAHLLGLRRIHAHGNPGFIYLEVQRQVEALWTVEQLDVLDKDIEELDSFSVNCISRAENEEATKLANYAAEYGPILMKRKSGSESHEDARQECLICLEKIFSPDMMSLTGCGHGFCFTCLSQHVETEISANKVPVRCPLFTDSCAVNLDDDRCKRLVSPKVFDTYLIRMTEAAIPDSEKVYCPFPGCSAMMRRTDEYINETNKYAASSSMSTPPRTNIGSVECLECHRLFCVECHVPWHADLTCQQHQDLPLDERDADDRKLFQLAKTQKWRKCDKCRRLIILAEGCFHITCRCGNEFCYTCGANYHRKQKMCSCPLFNDIGFPRRPRIHEARIREAIDQAHYRAGIPEERVIPRATPTLLRIPPMLEELMRQNFYEAERNLEERVPEEWTPEGRIPPATHGARFEERIPEGWISRPLHQVPPHRGRSLEERVPEESLGSEERIPEGWISRRLHQVPPHRGRSLEERVPEERIPEGWILEESVPEERVSEERIPEGWIPRAMIPSETLPNLTFPVQQRNLFRRSLDARTRPATLWRP